MVGSTGRRQRDTEGRSRKKSHVPEGSKSPNSYSLQENDKGELVDRYGIVYPGTSKARRRHRKDWRYRSSESSSEESRKAVARSPAERESLAPLMGSKVREDVIQTRRRILNKKKQEDEQEEYENSKQEEPYEALPLEQFTNVDPATISLLREILNKADKKEVGKGYINIKEVLEAIDLERKKKFAEERLALDAFMTPSKINGCAVNLATQDIRTEPYENEKMKEPPCIKDCYDEPVTSASRTPRRLSSDYINLADLQSSHRGKKKNKKISEEMRHSLDAFLKRSTRQRKKSGASDSTRLASTIFENDSASERTARPAERDIPSIHAESMASGPGRRNRSSSRSRRHRRRSQRSLRTRSPGTFHQTLDSIIGAISPPRLSAEVSSTRCSRTKSRASSSSVASSCPAELARERIFIGISSSRGAARKLRNSSLPFLVYFDSRAPQTRFSTEVPCYIQLSVAYQDDSMKCVEHYPIEEVGGENCRGFAVMHRRGQIKVLPTIGALVDFHLAHGFSFDAVPSASTCDCPYE